LCAPFSIAYINPTSTKKERNRQKRGEKKNTHREASNERKKTTRRKERDKENR
jgi:hypothetical protein